MDFRADILSHRDRLYRQALSILADAAEAEDVVQDVMLRAWEHRGEWDQIENMQAWLAQVCKRLALDKRKHAALLRRTPLSDDTLDAARHTSLSGHASDMERHETLHLLCDLIADLPSPLDDLVRLRDIEGMSYRDIALQLNLSEDQVRVYLHRARGKLRERYLKLQRTGMNP